jgi:hypothetical protein
MSNLVVLSRRSPGFATVKYPDLTALFVSVIFGHDLDLISVEGSGLRCSSIDSIVIAEQVVEQVVEQVTEQVTEQVVVVVVVVAGGWE